MGRTLLAELLDLVLPTSCVGCAAPGTAWCPRCRAAVRPAAGTLTLSRDGAAEGFGPLRVTTVGRYSGPLRTALLGYKERGRRDLAGPLAELLAAAMPTALPTAAGGGRPCVVPVPSRPAAARQRGGDHVLRLARALAARLDAADRAVAVAPVLRIRRGTRDSVGLDPDARRANLAGRVHLGGHPPPGQPVLLLDDVVTTGATLRAAAGALCRAGFPVRSALVLCDATRRTRH